MLMRKLREQSRLGQMEIAQRLRAQGIRPNSQNMLSNYERLARVPPSRDWLQAFCQIVGVPETEREQVLDALAEEFAAAISSTAYQNVMRRLGRIGRRI